ncbi:MAG TPA: cyclase family protein [Planctomycetota bacterium]|nr:cyclase family protein [Planctomycetota bacterium]
MTAPEAPSPLYDISPPVDEKTAVWPGDTPFSKKEILRIADGAPVDLSTITLTCHMGAHADAPSHYVGGAEAIDAVPLERYLGPCLLVDVKPKGDAVRPSDLEGVDLRGAERLLLRTGCIRDRTVFPKPVICLTVELVEHMAAAGIVLVGLDSPSVDPFDSKDLPVHKALYRHGIANLENLALQGVPPGRYELIALPLRLRGRDASPVRAVLRPPGRR